MIPIFKKGDKQLIKHYRPISLLPICGMIFEKIIFNSLYDYLHTNNLITKNQSEVLFSCKTSFPSHPQIMFNGTVVAKMNEYKHLGLILDSSLSFKKHLNEKIIKAKKNLGIIKHLSIFLPRKTLHQMYKALIRSHLDYCHIIYHIPSVQTQFGVTITDLMEKAERIQYQAALAVTGAWQGSSRSKLYEELGWESLSERRWCRRILQLHKIVTTRILILKTNSHDTADPCAVNVIIMIISFMK